MLNFLFVLQELQQLHSKEAASVLDISDRHDTKVQVTPLHLDVALCQELCFIFWSSLQKSALVTFYSLLPDGGAVVLGSGVCRRKQAGVQRAKRRRAKGERCCDG